jgi:CRP-like cAMP-binding protein
MTEIPCSNCPLRRLSIFLESTFKEGEVIQSLKERELILHANEILIFEGQKNARLFTRLDGWAFRFKTLSDGRRQILEFLLAGNLIGVQHEMNGVAAYGVAKLTNALFCVFQEDSLWQFHRRSAKLGFNVTRLTAYQKAIADDTLLSVGLRNAEQRIATLLIVHFKRAAVLEADRGAAGVPFPLTQQHMADALGMSLVHTNKTLRQLELIGRHRIKDNRLHMLNGKALAKLADFCEESVAPQQLLV